MWDYLQLHFELAEVSKRNRNLEAVKCLAISSAPSELCVFLCAKACSLLILFYLRLISPWFSIFLFAFESIMTRYVITLYEV